MKSLNIAGKLVPVDSPQVMGILNVTPDSFFEGSRVQQVEDVLIRAGRMLDEGALFLDIGGYSSRPGADDISEEEEVHRVTDPIRELVSTYPEAILSIDTFRTRVAEAAVAAGCHMVNDISGGQLDPNMHKLIGELQVPYIGMHMRGNPQDMKSLNQYDDLLTDIARFFSGMIESLDRFQVKDVIIDPGFGFAKNVEQNFRLLDSLEYFRFFEKLILAGLSRKSMIYKTLEDTPKNALNGTTVLNTVALQKGAHILRVHDVKEAVEAIKLTNRLHK